MCVGTVGRVKGSTPHNGNKYDREDLKKGEGDEGKEEDRSLKDRVEVLGRARNLGTLLKGLYMRDGSSDEFSRNRTQGPRGTHEEVDRRGDVRVVFGIK